MTEENKPEFVCEYNYDYDSELYFSGEISLVSAHYLSRKLKEIEKDKEPFVDKTLNLHLTSDGGCVSSGLKLYDAIASSTLDITVIAEGMVASAATFMMFAKKAKMTRHAFLLLHEINFGFFLSHSNVKAHLEHVDKLTTAIIAIYNKKINPPIVRELIYPDWIIDSTKALELGIVDEVIG